MEKSEKDARQSENWHCPVCRDRNLPEESEENMTLLFNCSEKKYSCKHCGIELLIPEFIEYRKMTVLSIIMSDIQDISHKISEIADKITEKE